MLDVDYVNENIERILKDHHLESVTPEEFNRNIYNDLNKFFQPEVNVNRMELKMNGSNVKLKIWMNSNNHSDTYYYTSNITRTNEITGE